MTFDEVLSQVQDLLQREQRVSYRGLKRRFALDDEYVEDLKEELIGAKRLASDEDGRFLVWTGPEAPAAAASQARASPPPSLSSHQSPSPTSYTPLHLAERIRAEQAALEARGSSEGERKTITALFAELKGSTELIEGIDTEEARAI